MAQTRAARAVTVAAVSRDHLLAGYAEEAEGVLCTEELHACGLSPSAISRWATSGRLHRLHHRVYALGHRRISRLGSFIAAVKSVGSDAVLSHYAAAAFWGMVDWDGRLVDVTVTGSLGQRRRDVRVHRTKRLERRDWVVRNGIRVTTPERTLVDLAAVVPPQVLRRAVRQALAEQLVSVRSLVAAIARSRRRPGVARLAALVADGHVPTRSELEDVVYDLILRGGFEPPDVNVPLELDGRRVIPDFRWPAQKLIVEADGARWHGDLISRVDDAERQALLEAHGERVLRVTWAQATSEATRTLARLSAAGAPRRSA